MRCQACDFELSDYESTRKDANGQYVDFCNTCYHTIKGDLPSTTRKDLQEVISISQEILEVSDI